MRSLIELLGKTVRAMMRLIELLRDPFDTFERFRRYKESVMRHIREPKCHEESHRVREITLRDPKWPSGVSKSSGENLERPKGL